MDDNYLDMTPEEMQELLGEFLAEGDGHLQVLNEKLLQAEDAIKDFVKIKQIIEPDMGKHRQYLELSEQYRKIYRAVRSAWT